MNQLILNAPLGIVTVFVLVLLINPKVGLAKAAIIAALASLAVNPSGMAGLLGESARHLFIVLIIMSATTLPVVMMMEDGLGENLSTGIVRLCAHRRLSRLPSSIVLPCIFLPTAMVAAMAIHNIPSILVLAPLAILLAKRFEAPMMPTLFGMLVASNLGGASFAAGDTPAILQRAAFGFDVATFSGAMVPRNLVVLLVLILTTAFLSWYPTRKKGGPSWVELYQRLQTRDYLASQSAVVGGSKSRPLAIFALIALIGSQFVSTNSTTVVAILILSAFLATSRNIIKSAFVLGAEAWLTIGGLMIMATAVQGAPIVQATVNGMLDQPGGVALTAYFVTAMISADGAAGMLTTLVHTHANGNFSAAWSLAAGICAGSSMLLSSASAGPILIEAAKREGYTITFRSYAAFGVPFSLVMLALYLLINFLFGA